MTRPLVALLFVAFSLCSTFAQAMEATAKSEVAVFRAEGFQLLWEPLHRTVEDIRGGTFGDVTKDHPSFRLLTFARARKILQDDPRFYPEEPLRLNDALLWLLRSRNVAEPSDISYETLTSYSERYALLPEPQKSFSDNPTITHEELMRLMETLDTFLREERHEISFYGEEFAGEGTAFGERFNPNEFTAAHRTFPWNTLVRVTHVDSGKSVVIRINDRGPYVEGRDMDLSLAAFEMLAPRSVGVLRNVTFERHGSADVASSCLEPRYQRRLGRTVLTPGIPRTTTPGTTLQLSGNRSFRVLQILPLRGRPMRSQGWTRRGEIFDIIFEHPGTYILILLPDGGRRQRFRTEVVPCS